MRILLLSYSYHPNGTAEANLWSKLQPFITKKNHQLDVLTTNNEIENFSLSTLNDSNIFRFFVAGKHSAKTLLREAKGLKKVSCFIEKYRTARFLKQKNFLSKLLVKKTARALKHFRLFDYDIIVTSCGCFELYEAAKYFIKKNNLQTKLVVYQIDPLSNNSSFSSKSRQNRLTLEKDMAIHADAIITTKILRQQKENLGIPTDNVICCDFPCISDETSFETRNTPSTLNAVFCGFLYEDLRNPEFALKCFSQIKIPSFTFNIIGAGSEALVQQYALASNQISYIGQLPLSQAQTYIQNADFLVNIGNSDINFVPSKIFDYISTGKPIINFYKHPDCPTLTYLNRYDASISLYEQDSDISTSLQLLTKFILDNKNTRIPYSKIENAFRENTVEYASNIFCSVFLKLSNRDIST